MKLSVQMFWRPGGSAPVKMCEATTILKYQLVDVEDNEENL